MSADPVPLCCLCGMPAGVAKLLRMTFVDDGKGRLRDMRDFPTALCETFRMPSIRVAKAPQSNDSFLCEDCLRGIKRIPFGDIHDSRGEHGDSK